MHDALDGSIYKNSTLSNPTVSIGMPVFNGEKTLRQAINSILAQSYSDIELIISDNSSTDLTREICENYLNSDNRVIYSRQHVNIGAEANFGKVLSKARGMYFMWAASDDWWHPLFIESNISNLESHPNAIASISNVLLNNTQFNEPDSGVTPLTGSVISKLRTFCQQPGANSRFYSLFRRQALDNIVIERGHVAADWSIIVDLILKGDMLTCHEYTGFKKSLSGAGSSPNRFSAHRKSAIEYIFPYAQFSYDVFTKTKDPATLFFLARLNARANLERLMNFLRA